MQVIDSGIDVHHPDLQKNRWRNLGESDCADGVDDDGNGFVDDCLGYNHADGAGGMDRLMGDGSHGTHCAGTISADGDNGIGVSGVGGGKRGERGLSLMVSVAFGASSSGGFAEALVYGADNGAKVSSNSWGYSDPGVFEQSVLDAIDYASGKGVLVVFAAGNDASDDEYYPAAYEPCIAVAATDVDGEAAFFTNRGAAWVDVSAPGHPVLSTLAVKDGSYGFFSGTSMATPHVAGALGLALSHRPDRTPAEVKACLFSSAVDLSTANPALAPGSLGAGLLEVSGLLDCLGEAPSLAPSTTQSPTPLRTPPPSAAPSACDCTHTLVLVVASDGYPMESSYALTSGHKCDGGGVRAGRGDNWAPGATTSIDVGTNLCAGAAYTFTFSDAYGDGICCAYGDGGYRLELDGVVVHASNGQFGAADVATVVIPSTRVPTGSPTPRPAPASCAGLGWANANAYGSPAVCGESDLGLGGCSGAMTHAAAEAFCAGGGARLCTVDELAADEARGTGCGYDQKNVWSSTVCGAEGNAWKIAPGSTLLAAAVECKGSVATRNVRCCADA